MPDSYVAGVLVCDACGAEGRAVARKAGALWLAQGVECHACGKQSCHWADEDHFDDEAAAHAHATACAINEAPQPPPVTP